MSVPENHPIGRRRADKGEVATQNWSFIPCQRVHSFKALMLSEKWKWLRLNSMVLE